MGDNTTKLVLHINNETGKVEKAEQEDAAGNRTEVTGTFDNVTVKNEPTSEAQMNWRIAPDSEPTGEGDDTTKTQGSSEAPSV